MYEDYLEEFVFKTAAVITEKLFGRKPNPINLQSNDKKPTPPAAAITQPKVSTTNQTKDKPIEKPAQNVDVPTTSLQSEDKKEKVTEIKTDTKTETKIDTKIDTDTDTDTDSDMDIETKIETKTEDKNEIKKSETIKPVKKVEFNVSDDEQQKHDKSQEPLISTETNVAESKKSLDAPIDGDAIVKSSSQESFELLYSQLDPEDVAMFSQKDEPEEMTEEQRLELEKAEAGKSHSKYIVFKIEIKASYLKKIIIYRIGSPYDTNGRTAEGRRGKTKCRNENCSRRIR